MIAVLNEPSNLVGVDLEVFTASGRAVTESASVELHQCPTLGQRCLRHPTQVATHD